MPKAMGGLIKLFTAPGELFSEVRDGKRGWAVPLTALVITAILGTAALFGILGQQNYAAVVRKQLEANSMVASRLSPAQIDQAVQQSSSPARRALSTAAAGLMTLVVVLIVSGLLAGLMAIADANPSFKKVLAVSSYSFFAYYLVTMLLSVVVLALMQDKSDADLSNLLMFNLGAALNKETTNKFVYSFASSMDLLTIGNLLLLSLGLSKLSPALSFGKALTMVAVLWLVWVLIKGGFAMIFG